MSWVHRVCCILLFSFFISEAFTQNPSDISGLRLWLRGDTGLTILGGKIQTWEDRSGSVNNAVQNTLGLRPTYVPSILNGYGGAQFDNLDDGMSTTLSLSTDSFAIFVLYRNSNSSAVGRRAVQGGTANWLMGPHSGSYQMYANGFVTGPAANSSKFVYQTCVQVPSVVKNYVNGALYGSLNTPSYPGLIDLGASGLIANESLEGEIVEVIAYNTFLKDSLRMIVEQYLHQKYAPPVNLGPDITASNFCAVTLDASDRFTNYIWSPGGATTQTVSVNQSGTYSVTATDVFGATSTDAVNVTYPGNFTPFPGNATTICAGSPVTWSTNLSPASSYTFAWSTG
ncbi:MAG: hypothetical protein EPN85_13455, partial [Bacteroidetes bacterium]